MVVKTVEWRKRREGLLSGELVPKGERWCLLCDTVKPVSEIAMLANRGRIESCCTRCISTGQYTDSMITNYIRTVKGYGIATLQSWQWKFTMRVFHYCCAYCRRETKLQHDHAIPIYNGGDYVWGNVVPACHDCNKLKCESTVSAFMWSKWGGKALPRLKTINNVLAALTAMDNELSAFGPISVEDLSALWPAYWKPAS